MIAELGNYTLALALAISILLAVLPLWGAEKQNSTLIALARPMTWAMFFGIDCLFWFAVLSVCGE